MVVAHATAGRLPASQVIPPEYQDVQHALPERQRGNYLLKGAPRDEPIAGLREIQNGGSPTSSNIAWRQNLSLRTITRHAACFEDLR
jgi:hypothetical protein